jgi:hypothetical protein
MAKRMKGDIVTTLMIIGGIFILLSVIVIGIDVFQSVKWGPCWANFGQEMSEIDSAFDKLKTQESTEETVTMGDCVGMLVFANKNELTDLDTAEFKNPLECPDKPGFIIGLPYFEETESGWRFWLWRRDIAENIIKTWEEMGRGIGPLCRGLDQEVSSMEIKGPGDGQTRVICLKLAKVGDSYGVDYEEGSCADA